MKYELCRYIDGILHYLMKDGGFSVDRADAWKMSPGRAYKELKRLRKEYATISPYAWLILRAGEAGVYSDRVLLRGRR